MPNPYAVRFEDGPFAGKTGFAKEDPGEKILALATEFVAPGSIVCVAAKDRHKLAMYEDNELTEYERVTTSQLPADFEHPNVMRGGTYREVKEASRGE